MVFFCLSEDCFDSNHSMDGHFPTGMEAHHSGGSREYHSARNSIHGKGPAPSLPGQQQMPVSMSQSAISSQLAPPTDHRQQHFSSSQDLDDKYNEKYLDKYSNNDSCKQMGLQIGLQPKQVSSQFHVIAENESELSVPSPMPPTPRPLQRHYSVVDPKSFTDMGRNLPGRGGWPIGFESAIAATIGENPGTTAFLLTMLSIIIIFLTMPVSLLFCIKVVQEYERAVIFRLGRLLKGGAKGPGIFFIVPCIDTYSKVDLRTVSFDVPPQEILSKDSVTVAVDAVVYYRIFNATIAISNVEDYGRSTRLLAATTLRNVLGTKNLSEILSERESISHVMQTSLDEATDSWGVKVERVEIKDVRLPVQLQRAMATEAEAAREARAKVIAAEGEQRASKALKEAAEVIEGTPSALQLRYLQTLNSIAAEKNSTIVFPIPIEMFHSRLSILAARNRRNCRTCTPISTEPNRHDFEKTDELANSSVPPHLLDTESAFPENKNPIQVTFGIPF